jgi:hypothetical protein
MTLTRKIDWHCQIFLDFPTGVNPDPDWHPQRCRSTKLDRESKKEKEKEKERGDQNMN